MKYYYTLEETLIGKGETIEPQRARLIKGQGVYELENSNGMLVHFDKEEVVNSKLFKKRPLTGSKRFMPDYGQTYFCIDFDRGALRVVECINRNVFVTMNGITSHNVFETEEAAEEALARIKG